MQTEHHHSLGTRVSVLEQQIDRLLTDVHEISTDVKQLVRASSKLEGAKSSVLWFLQALVVVAAGAAGFFAERIIGG